MRSCTPVFTGVGPNSRDPTRAHRLAWQAFVGHARQATTSQTQRSLAMVAVAV